MDNSLNLPSRVWDKLGLNYLGPTIVAQKGVALSVNWQNQLPSTQLFGVDTTIHGAMGSTTMGIHVQPHLHGGLTVASSDGNPFATPAFLGKTTYTYRNKQDAATLWYHDHALGITRLNVYAGLAAFYLIRDNKDTGVGDNAKTKVDENPLDLPANYFGVDYTGDYKTDANVSYELPLVIQDKTFTSTGQQYYPTQPGNPLAGPGNPVVPVPPGVDPLGNPNPFPGSPTSPTIVPEYAGNIIVANGVAWPKLDVEGRTYRFHLLNGSDSRFYDLQLSSDLTANLPFQVIGSDDGLLDGPAVSVSHLMIAPGERYDVIVDFSKKLGQTFTLKNVNGRLDAMPIFNDRLTTGQIMQFNVKTTPPTIADPIAPQWKVDLRPDPIDTIPVWKKNADGSWTSRWGTTTRPGQHALGVFEGLDPYGRIYPNLGTVNQGTLLWDDPSLGGVAATSAETVTADTYTLFEVYNTTSDFHPIHLHGASFQILERQAFEATLAPKFITTSHRMPDGTMMSEVFEGTSFVDQNGDGLVNTKDITLEGMATPRAAYEAGFKDTAIVAPSERVLLVAKYGSDLLLDPNGAAAGKYVWHCHILSHEEHEMMRPLLLTPKPSLGATAPVIANAPSTIAPAATNPLNSALTPFFATSPIAV